MTKKFYVSLAMLLCASIAFAGGPKKVARSDRSLWPYAINSPSEFDFASKMEMLVFAGVLQSYEKITPEDSLKKLLGVEKISTPSLVQWEEQTKKLLVVNFRLLTTQSSHDFITAGNPQNWQQIIEVAGKLKQKMPDNLKAWFANATDFYDTYIYEQMRLAALFPRVTSEILTLSDEEISGFNYRDKQFLLTFDDGPSPASGTTDKLIATLNNNHVNGIFFVLGDMLATRLKASSPLKLRDLYKPMIIGSHGKVHKQHPKYEDWQFSLSFTDNLIDSVAPENKNVNYFRPPYGQRTDKMITYVTQHRGHVMLWNIDSQDWNAKISSTEVADRVMTLMLLWRRGIILFHDTHPKANLALPIIWEDVKNSGVTWMDVKTLK